MREKLPSISKLKKKADAIFSKWVRQRDGHKCYTCMKQLNEKESQCGHYVSRSYLYYRYDETNCHVQCVDCNVFKHGNMTVYALKIINQYGTKKLKEFEFNKTKPVGNTRDFLNKIIQKYATSPTSR